MENMQFYNALRSVPQEAKKTIGAGKLKGFTDINPMWRIQRLTEVYGPVGFGWTADIIEHWTEQAAGESTAWVTVALRVKDAGTGAWSEPIHGIGGSKQAGKGQGDGINDEAFKMAYTDAISVACKSLGMAADVYFEKGAKVYGNSTKYDLAEAPAPKPDTAPARDAQGAPLPAMTDELYWGIVRAYGDGRKSKTGGDYRAEWIQNYKPGKTQIEKFDHDVENYRAAKNGGASL